MKLRKKQIGGLKHSVILSGLSSTMTVSTTTFKIEGNEGIMVTVNGVDVTESIVFSVNGGGTKAAAEINYKDELTGIDFSGLSFSVDANDTSKITARFKESDVSNGITFS